MTETSRTCVLMGTPSPGKDMHPDYTNRHQSKSFITEEQFHRPTCCDHFITIQRQCFKMCLLS